MSKGPYFTYIMAGRSRTLYIASRVTCRSASSSTNKRPTKAFQPIQLQPSRLVPMFRQRQRSNPARKGIERLDACQEDSPHRIQQPNMARPQRTVVSAPRYFKVVILNPARHSPLSQPMRCHPERSGLGPHGQRPWGKRSEGSASMRCVTRRVAHPSFRTHFPNHRPRVPHPCPPRGGQGWETANLTQLICRSIRAFLYNGVETAPKRRPCTVIT
jgi:hypothetical protein